MATLCVSGFRVPLRGPGTTGRRGMMAMFYRFSVTDRSDQSGFMSSIKVIFQSRRHFLRLFSRAMASSIRSCTSYQTSRETS